uniref:ATP-dependent DNA helicase n=1 Tax=Trichocoleus desertorum TaxID=1481672 RepID=UPI0025B47DA8|nr:ATP-dependent DNA helicase [Trichocoleus desertorum]
MIEVEVHQQLRAFLREQGEPYWPHHLTMGRLVARALRLGRSALIQAGAPSGSHARYRLSYLVPLLIWPGAAVLAVPEEVQQRLLMVEIPRLRQWIQTPKPIRTGDRWPGPDFQGLLLTTPEQWLSDRLGDQSRFPEKIPTILDGVDDLEAWAQQQLTAQLEPSHWNDLMLARPDLAETIRDVRVQLTRAIFQHPANPYECYLIESEEREILETLFQPLSAGQVADPDASFQPLPAPEAPNTTPRLPGLPDAWSYFWERLQNPDQLVWATIDRQHGQFSVYCGPIDVAPALEKIWPQQPVVLIGGALDLEPEAPIYRQRLGLKDLTCLKFAPDRQSELIQLYLPDGLPMPNTPQFQAALVQEVRALLNVSLTAPGLAVLLVGDVPLKAQIGSILAGEFGSRVQVEKTCLDDNGILVTGWEFWRQYQHVLPAPHLLAIATLPIPSLEHPLVAGRVAYYKRLRQDWFRLYLLPTALSELQRAIAPVRERQGVVALLDNRVLHRSYGHQVLAALSPLARINYLDPTLFNQSDYSVLD